MEFVSCTGKTTQPHAFEAVVNLQVGKAHLDAFALVTRLEKKPSSALAGAPNLVRPHEDRAGLVAQACWDSIVS
jgi:hypothetical protein